MSQQTCGNQRITLWNQLSSSSLSDLWGLNTGCQVWAASASPVEPSWLPSLLCFHVVQDGVQVPVSEGDLRLLIFLTNARITVMCTTFCLIFPFMLLFFYVLSIEGKSLHMDGKYSTNVLLVLGFLTGSYYIYNSGWSWTHWVTQAGLKFWCSWPSQRLQV